MEKKVRVHIAFKFCLCFVTCPMPAGGSKYCRILRIKRYRLQQRLCPLSVFSFCSCLHFFAERVREHLKSPSILMAYKFILLFKVIGLKKKIFGRAFDTSINTALAQELKNRLNIFYSCILTVPQYAKMVKKFCQYIANISLNEGLH